MKGTRDNDLSSALAHPSDFRWLVTRFPREQDGLNNRPAGISVWFLHVEVTEIRRKKIRH